MYRTSWQGSHPKYHSEPFSCGASLPVQADPCGALPSPTPFPLALLPCRMISDSPYIHTPNLWITVYHICRKMSSLRCFLKGVCSGDWHIYRGAGSLGDRGFPRIGGYHPATPGHPFRESACKKNRPRRAFAIKKRGAPKRSLSKLLLPINIWIIC